jgi:DNA-binding transcriptional LysR family regulator
MKKVNLRRHNLNGLPVLREILLQGNLTKAAISLGLTQPALSNILKQLRAEFDDMLVVRQGQKMQLTPKAQALIGPLDQALKSVEDVLLRSRFDPATSDRRFRIATTDFIMGSLGGALSDHVMTNAPGISVLIDLAQRSSVDALMVGDIDMVITPTILLTAGISSRAENERVSSEILLTDDLVCMAHVEDEEFRAGLTVEQYLNRPHACYVFGDQNLTSMEHIHLQRLGLRQVEKILVSSYAALPAIVARAGLLALVPQSFAKMAATCYPLQFAPPPFDATNMGWSMVWHNRQDQSAEMDWLRMMLKKSVGSQ